MKKTLTSSAKISLKHFFAFLFLLITCLPAFSQNVGINATGAAPNANAGLDVDFTNKGVLIPRLALSSTSSFSPLAAHVAGMIVFNTATANDVKPGFYYNNGSAWIPDYPTGTATGNMLYWNGTTWITIPVGLPGQYLTLNGSLIPQWAGANAYAVISTTAATSISDVQATSGGNITSDGGSAVLSRGVCWSTLTNPTIADNKTVDGSGTGAFISTITGLVKSTTYYVRAYAINSATITYGAEISFTTTTPVPPTLAATTAATSILATSVTTGGDLLDNGFATITARGVCYSSVNAVPTIADSKLVDAGTGLGAFTSNLTGLTSNTVYYVRSYATNSIGTGYGAVMTFTTQPIISSTTAASAITTTGATSGGTITAGGGASITARGVCWSTALNPTIADPKTSDGTLTGTFVSSITGLAYTTLYHVRAYATNAGGTVYGNDITFTTSTPVAPTVTTTAATSITGSGAASGGNVTADGGAPITERGIVYSLSSNPTTASGTKIINGAPGTGTYTSTITGLSGGTNYNIRAYAINIAGTSYGANVAFTTTVTPPTLVTVAVTNIAGGSVTSGGSMNWNGPGYSNFGAYGVAYSTTSNAASPTKVATNSSTGGVNPAVNISPWITNINGLAGSTTYYLRSYLDVYNAGWITIYGPEISFTTTGATVPIVATTNAATTITGSTATSGGTITSDGGSAITAKGVVWGVTPNPVLGAGNFTSNGAGATLFTSYITGLTGSTIYYLRAYATNSIGTAYAPVDVTFTTLPASPYTLGQNVGYGIVGYVAPDGSGFIVSPSLALNGAGWGCSGTSIATGTALGTGKANTALILANCADRPIAASIAASYNGGGFSDWYLPSSGEWQMMSLFASYVWTGVNVGYNDYYTSSQDNLTPNDFTWASTVWATGGSIGGARGLKASHQYATAIRAIRDFAASPLIAPTVLSTTAISALTATGASTGGYISSDGGAAVTARGVCWNTTGAPTIADPKTTDGTGMGGFTSTLTGLTTGQTYHVRAYATNSVNTSYGPEISFTPISPGFPQVTSAAVSAIGSTSATSGGNVTSDAGFAVTARGVCWSTSVNPTVALTTKTVDGSGLGTFVSSIAGLTTGTMYHVRAYATNANGTSYGSESTFTPFTFASVTTAAITNLAGISATTGGNVTNENGSPVTARGVCWSTATGPTTANSVLADAPGTGPGAYVSNITGLTSGTLYYLRAYATNGAGTSYGNEVVFTTPVIPTLTTTAITNLTGTSATSGGSITSDGGSSVSARGVCWSTTTGPTTANSVLADVPGTGTGIYVSNLTGLTAGTTYYLRAYATNSVGTAYGNEVSFTPGLPALSTDIISAITPGSATSGGNITSDGGNPVTSRGICWSTASMPDIAFNYSGFTTNGTGTGSFISNLTNLSPSTTYYVRAYATTISGTAYGNEETFTTLAPTAPVVGLTDPVINIALTSATSGGSVISNGGLSTTGGVCWSTTSPAVLDLVNFNYTTDAYGVGAYVSAINGLISGTKYYVRAYATNSLGTTYDLNEVSFTTLAPVLATVTTNAVTNILGTSATSGGDVLNEGSDPVYDRGICWSLTADPTIVNPLPPAIPTNFVLSVAKYGLGSFAGDLTGLTPATVYHLRAYATNSAGTAYGADVPFTTGTGLAIPSITTDALTSQTSTGVTTGGTITSDGGSVINERGVCWSTMNTNPTITDSKIIDPNPNNGLPFVSTITGLTAGTNYYIRAYATNAQGIAYGASLMYTPIGTPTVTTYPLVYTPGSSTATSGVYVAYPYGGDYNLVALGICWSTASNPDIANHTNGGITIANQSTSYNAAYNEPITGLITSPATTYYVRAYGTNISGFTGYGAEITFTTGLAGGAPSVSTDPITDLLGSVALGGLTILSDGGSTITAGGVCWGLSADPDINNHLGMTNDGTFAGTFASGITGLTIGTTYHVRAYATNGNSTSYGADVTFVATAATVGQYVNSAGYSGIVYSIDGTGSHGLISSFGYSYTDWGCTGANVGTTLSNGFANTDAIAANITSGSCLSGSTMNMFAANVCKLLGTAWYLPSKDEFTFLWNNSTAGGLNFNLTPTGGPYWSSSEVDGTPGTKVWFFDGTTWQNTGVKSSLMKVWPVRSF